ncbi:outer membrane beta-barrel protein [Flavihumibacter sp.]|uniref:outer membrane beta-barrel protein n=1 Tax=Flavihumibacter sp. TaxID=1913981 RepID=UPI002FCBE3E0
MLKQIFLAIAVLAGSISYAQMPTMQGGAPRGRAGGANMNMGRFYGRIIDAASNKGIEAASVQLVTTKLDTVSKQRKDTVVAGMFTDKRGEFTFEGLNVMAQYRMRITAIGFKDIEEKVAFNIKMGGGDMQAALNAIDKDLGNFKMETDPKLLEGVTVTAAKPLMSMGIDRKVFNVDKNLVSTGGTAEDVMRNIPSISVDIDGNVTLRNSAPQIFVDGRPTTLTLDQIPADAIESVELITNPSAKFDASGGTAGILNIVLKKNRKAGYNGSIRAGIDSRWKPNIGGDLNVKQGKVNMFVSGMYRTRKSISEGNTNRTTFLKDPTTRLNQDDYSVNTGSFMFGRAGFDYFMNNRNTIGVAVNAVRGQFKFDNESAIRTDSLFDSGIQSAFSERLSDGDREFRNFGSQIYYKRLFTKPGRELTADLNLSRNSNLNNTNIKNILLSGDNGSETRRYGQLNTGDGTGSNLTFQTDFVNPLNENSKLETGFRLNANTRENINEISVISGNGQPVLVPSLSSNFEYTEKVYAGYVTYTSKWKKLGYQVGLRAESSEYDGEVLTTTAPPNSKDTLLNAGNSFPISFFPSAFLTYQLSDNDELALNITRRINRPNFFQLFPFTDYSDTLNLTRGNPNLKPEFTASAEMSYQKKYGQANSFIASVYYKHTNNLITRNQVRDVNPYTKEEEIVISYINADNSYISGLELIGRNKITKWWELISNFNLYQSKINAGQPGIPDQEAITSYFIKLNNNIKLGKKLTLQLSGDYTSKTILPPGGGGGGGMWGATQTTAQGYIRPKYEIEAALRLDFLKENRANLTLAISDIFRTDVNDVYSSAPGFEQNTWRLRDPQVARLNFSYRFGKFDTSLFKRKNMRPSGDNQNMGDQF